MATHSSILAWRIPWTEEPGRPWSIGSQRVGHNWSDWACWLSGNWNLLLTDSKIKWELHLIHLIASGVIWVEIVSVEGEWRGELEVQLFQALPIPPCVCSVTQSCLTLCYPRDCSLPGSSVSGIFQARILELVTIFFLQIWPETSQNNRQTTSRIMQTSQSQSPTGTENNPCFWFYISSGFSLCFPVQTPCGSVWHEMSSFPGMWVYVTKRLHAVPC